MAISADLLGRFKMPRPRDEQQQRRWVDQQKRMEERLRVGSAVEWEIDRPEGVRNGETIEIPGPLAQAEDIGFLPEPGSIIITAADGAAYRQQPPGDNGRRLQQEPPIRERVVPVCPLCRDACRLGTQNLVWSCPSCRFEITEGYLARFRGTFRRPTRDERQQIRERQVLGEATLKAASPIDLLRALDTAGQEIDRLQEEKKALIFANKRLLRESTPLDFTAPGAETAKRRIELE
jgi:ribosomal protein L37AE/L43A